MSRIRKEREAENPSKISRLSNWMQFDDATKQTKNTSGRAELSKQREQILFPGMKKQKFLLYTI